MKKFLEGIFSKTLSEKLLQKTLENIRSGHHNDAEIAAFITAFEAKADFKNVLSLISFLRAKKSDAIEIAFCEPKTPVFSLAAVKLLKNAGKSVRMLVSRAVSSSMGAADLLEALGDFPPKEPFYLPSDPFWQKSFVARKSLGISTYFEKALFLVNQPDVLIVSEKDQSFFENTLDALGEKPLILVEKAGKMNVQESVETFTKILEKKTSPIFEQILDFESFRTST